MNIEKSLIEAQQVEKAPAQPVEYEAPIIESVLTPESLEREVHYAGIQPTSGQAIA